MIPKPVRILAAAVLAVLGLVALAARESFERVRGVEVILDMEAVDPRALLSGHFVSLALRADIPADRPCPPGTGAPVLPSWVFFPGRQPSPWRWVALTPGPGGAAVAGAASDRAAAARFGSLLARGDAACQRVALPEAAGPAYGEVRLNLGIDRFYMSQSEAERVQGLLTGAAGRGVSPVQAIVSVGRDGRARMKGLVVQGRRIEPDWF